MSDLQKVRLSVLQPGVSANLEVPLALLDSQFAGRGRALKLRAGQTPSFIHQDMVLER